MNKLPSEDFGLCATMKIVLFLVVGCALSSSVLYQNIGSGKCVTQADQDPAHDPEWYYTFRAGVDEGRCREACNRDVNCRAFSTNDNDNCLLWNLFPLQAPQANNWGGAHCLLKDGAGRYMDMGLGKCVTHDRRNPATTKEWRHYGYHSGVGLATCKSMCNKDEACRGISVSGYHNCLVWRALPLHAPNNNDWAHADCMIKVNPRVDKNGVRISYSSEDEEPEGGDDTYTDGDDTEGDDTDLPDENEVMA